jgi:hypothetical protein
MRIVLALLALLIAAPVSAQNLTANRLQLLPAAPGACPVGKVCVVGTTSTAPYRVAFQDASGNTVTMGDAWRLRQCAGPCVGALNGDMWFDSGTGIAYIKQAGSNLPIGVGSSPVINGTITGTYTLGGTPSLGVTLNAGGYKIINLGAPTLATDAATKAYVDSTVASAGYVPTARTISTTAPLSGGGDLSANRTLSLSYGSDFTVSGGSLVLAQNVRASVATWNVINGTSISANGYWGPIGDTSATATLVSPFVAPCAGTIVGMRVQGNTNATGNSTVTLHRSAGGATISYAATLITCTISSGDKSCTDSSNTFSATAGDLFLLRITASNWSPSGGGASIRVACNAT